MFKTSLKSKLIIAVMVMFGITAFMSCEKEEILNVNSSNKTPVDNSTLKNSSFNATSEVKLPKENFIIVFKKNGTYSTNDKPFINSYPQIKSAFDNIAIKISNDNTHHGNTFFKISEDGVIISNNPFYNGKTIAEILYNEGHFSYFKESLIITFNDDGFLSVSHPEIFKQFPFLKDKLIQKGEEIKKNIQKDEIITLEITNNGEIIVNDTDVFYSNGGGDYDEDCTYEEFKDCVGDWWFLPGVNVVTCGVACVAIHYL